MSEDIIGRRGGHRGGRHGGRGGRGGWGGNFYLDTDPDLLILENVPSQDVVVINGQIVNADGKQDGPVNSIGGFSLKRRLKGVARGVAKGAGAAGSGVKKGAKATGHGISKGAQATARASAAAAKATAHASKIAAKYGVEYSRKYAKVMTYPLRQLAAGVVWGIMAPVRMLLAPKMNAMANGIAKAQQRVRDNNDAKVARKFFVDKLKSGNVAMKLAGKIVEEFGPGTSPRVSVSGYAEISGAQIVAGWVELLGQEVTAKLCGRSDIGVEPASASAVLASVMATLSAALPALGTAATACVSKLAVDTARAKGQQAVAYGKSRLPTVDPQAQIEAAQAKFDEAKRRGEEFETQAQAAEQNVETEALSQAQTAQAAMLDKTQRLEAATQETAQETTEAALDPASEDGVQGWSEICGKQDLRLKVQTMEYPKHNPPYIKIIDANGPRAFILQIIKGDSIAQARRDVAAFVRASNWRITKVAKNLIDNTPWGSSRRHGF